MKTRVISGTVLTALLIVWIYFSYVPYIMNTVVALLSAFAVYEVATAIGRKGCKLYMPFCVAYAIGYQFIPQTSVNWRFTLLFALAGIMFLIAIFGFSKEIGFENLCPLFCMTVVISLFFSTLTILRSDEAYGLSYMIMVFLTAWGGDTGAYMFGRLVGKHKLAPHVSPKKTVEGFIGGVMTSVLFSVMMGIIVRYGLGKESVSFVLFVAMGLFGGIFAVIGDLAASVVKRNYDIKDYGKLIPGHGGIMDRFDSVMFTSAAFCCVKVVADGIAALAGSGTV